MSERVVHLVCDWCTNEWHEGDSEGEWFSYIPEFEDAEEQQFCSVSCFLSWL